MFLVTSNGHRLVFVSVNDNGQLERKLETFVVWETNSYSSKTEPKKKDFPEGDNVVNFGLPSTGA